jgi:hypothetical protein
MFSPLDILYIVLAFCALWLTAAIFWMIWQIATMLRNVNAAIAEGREVMHKVESALSGIRAKFDSTASSLGSVVDLAMRGVGYVIEKKMTDTPKRAPASKKTKK